MLPSLGQSFCPRSPKSEAVKPLTGEDTRILKTAGWLSLCEPAFVDAVLGKTRIQVLEAGEHLYRPGDPSNGIYGLLSGAFAVSFVVPESGPTVSHIILPGAWFGETAFARKPRNTGVHAMRATRAVVLPMRDIDALVQEEPRRWTGFVQLAILNGQLAMGAAYDLMLRNPLQRCAATLLRLAGLRHGQPLVEGPVELDISQADLAHMTNLSRNSVGALLRVLRDQQCVDVDYRQLMITDPRRLKTLLHADM